MIVSFMVYNVLTKAIEKLVPVILKLPVEVP